MTRVSGVELASIALQSDAAAVLKAATVAAREVADADSAFVAVRDQGGRYSLDVRVGLTDPHWPLVRIRPGRGMGGKVLVDMQPRTSHDYFKEPSITQDYVPIMRREELRGLGVVPVPDLVGGRPDLAPAGLIYVSTHHPGAPGDRVVDEVQRVAEVAAVGLARLRCRPVPAAADTASLTARELEVLGLLSEGCANKEIARRLVISEATVKGHVRAILRKLDAPSRLAAVADARRRRIL